ncbi:Gfo/Idh/MocA family oxidoreductase [Chitinivorax sp. B]|uniref:Gfo/Idh/MocA family protein n=1 Tax=Chitinivorax sp. B TaxID=2502235 RepID=UPI0010F83E83|nr:Gfo/Idh/MocA family oxidoreductase [Chitinivorax sp. B]
MSVIRVGIIGIGAQTRENLLPSLLQIPDIHIVAACDSELERARLLRSYVKDAGNYADVGEMLDNEQLDALVMACPPQAHRDIAMQAMLRGLHVFVEKPPCFTLVELEELADMAEQQGLVTAVGLNFRFARPIQHIRSVTASHAFGRTMHVQINHYANKPRTPLWGMQSTLRSFLLAQAIHSIDLATVFGSGEIVDLYSSVQRDTESLLARIDIAFASGVSASILTGTMFPYFEFDMKVISDRSTMISLDNLWNITLHELEHATRTAGSDKRWRGAWQPSPLDSGYVRSGYLGELSGFFDAIRHQQAFEGDFASLLPTFHIIEHMCREERPTPDLQAPVFGNRPINQRVTTNAQFS